jgi:hypothetical protein
MKLGGEDRAQSVQLGAVILFGFIIIGITTYQTTVVPDQNRQIEFNHEQTVRDDMVSLRNSIVAAGTTGNADPAEITLGTRFPSRTLFVNPPPAVGRLQTIDPPQGNVLVNVSDDTTFVGQPVDDEARDFWANKTRREYTTKFVVYTPNYRVYDGAPDNISIQDSNALAQYPGGNTINLTTTSRLVQDNRITIVLVKGDLEESGVSTASVDPGAISHITRREEVDGTVKLTIPTSLSPAELRGRLTVPASASVTVSKNTTTGGVDVLLQGRFTIGIAAVNVGSNEASEPDPAYIDVESIKPGSNVENDTTVTVEMEVRDRYGNPLSGVQINANSSGRQLPFVDTTVNTSSDGIALFQYNTSKLSPSSSTTYQLNFSYNYSSDELVPNEGYYERSPENATINLTVSPVSTPGGGSGGGGGTNGSWPLSFTNASNLSANSDTIISISKCNVDSCIVNDSVVLQVTTDGETNGATVSYGVNNTSVATINESSDTTSQAGYDTVQLSPQTNGTVVVSASSGGSTTTIKITIKNYISQPAEIPLITAVQPDPDLISDSDGEFIKLNIPDKVDTTDWKLEDADTGDTETITQNLSGVYYFARVPTAFEAQWDGIDSSQVLGFSFGLDQDGQIVKLLDENGNEIDRFAYEGSLFSDESTFSFSDTAGNVANRTRLSADGTYNDTDSASDWSEEDACQFFGGGNGCGAAFNVTVTGTPSTGDNSSEVVFKLKNNGDSDITITAVRWVSTSSSSATVIEAPGSGKGTLKYTSGKKLRRDPIFSDSVSKDSLNKNSTITSGSTKEYVFKKFKDDDGSEVNMSGETITIQFYFSDDSKKKITISVD